MALHQLESIPAKPQGVKTSAQFTPIAMDFVDLKSDAVPGSKFAGHVTLHGTDYKDDQTNDEINHSFFY
jgi:hypothetical protein